MRSTTEWATVSVCLKTRYYVYICAWGLLAQWIIAMLTHLLVFIKVYFITAIDSIESSITASFQTLTIFRSQNLLS